MVEPGVVFALVRNRRVLMQQRDGNCKKFPFMWCLPGGGCDVGESYEATLLREIKEEYNLDVLLENCRYIADHKDGNDPLRVYICEVPLTQNPELREGLAMKWMTIEEMEKIELGFHQDELVPILKMWML